MRNALFISLTLLAGPVSADQAAPNAVSTAQFGALRSQASNPYSRLFEVRSALKQVQSALTKQAPKRTIVCGMTIIEADPSFDQKMKVTPPKDANVRYTIRAVDPPVCNPASK